MPILAYCKSRHAFASSTLSTDNQLLCCNQNDLCMCGASCGCCDYADRNISNWWLQPMDRYRSMQPFIIWWPSSIIMWPKVNTLVPRASNFSPIIVLIHRNWNGRHQYDDWVGWIDANARRINIEVILMLFDLKPIIRSDSLHTQNVRRCYRHLAIKSWHGKCCD